MTHGLMTIQLVVAPDLNGDYGSLKSADRSRALEQIVDSLTFTHNGQLRSPILARDVSVEILDNDQTFGPDDGAVAAMCETQLAEYLSDYNQAHPDQPIAAEIHTKRDSYYYPEVYTVERWSLRRTDGGGYDGATERLQGLWAQRVEVDKIGATGATGYLECELAISVKIDRIPEA